MRLFLDTNIILEFIDHRDEYESVHRILADIRDGRHEGFISQGCVYTLTFLIERSLKAKGIHKPEQTLQLRRLLTSVITIFEPTGISRKDMLRAVGNEAFTDIEDSFQYQCAVENRCDILITINIDDFRDADQRRMRILTPTQFVEKYMKAF